MKLIAPEYYKDFKCIANKCNHSCCQDGWEIDIDEKTAKFYKNTTSELGNKLNKNITYDVSPHFILNENQTCPFLNKNKLCEIYIKLGEEHLCDICKEHPRYYEWFDNIKEAGIGLCCEEACRIILSQTNKFSTYEVAIPNENAEKYNKDLYAYLYNTRKKIIEHLEDNSFSLHTRIRDIIWYSCNIQNNIINKAYNLEEIDIIDILNQTNLKPILNELLKLDYMNSDLPNLIKKLDNFNIENTQAFEKNHPEIINYLKNISVYFIWRYFLKACFDEDVFSKIIFTAVSLSILENLFYYYYEKNKTITLDNCIQITREYSKEIEYSESNLQTIFNNCYNSPIFSADNIIGLFFEK